MYISRLHEKAAKCDFEQAEMSERLLEMLILYTPYEDYRKLLVKPKNFSLTLAIERGREFEAIIASQQSLNQMRTP